MESRQLFKQGYYGKPIGIAKPKIDEIDVPLILDLIEGLYLLERSIITIYDSRKKLGRQKLYDLCEKEYHDFSKKYMVYKDFREKKYIVTPGIKFGCDFAVYQKGPGIDHSPFLIQVYSRSDKVVATDIVRAGRLATSVKKQFILAIPYRNYIEYVALDWWRA